MIKILQFLIGGCWHKWVLISKDRLFDPKGSKTIPTGYVFVSQCEKCGKFKRQDLI